MGMTNREIAHELAIGERTVRFHIHNIYRKLKVPNSLTLNYVYGDQFRPIYPQYVSWIFLFTVSQLERYRMLS